MLVTVHNRMADRRLAVLVTVSVLLVGTVKNDVIGNGSTLPQHVPLSQLSVDRQSSDRPSAAT